MAEEEVVDITMMILKEHHPEALEVVAPVEVQERMAQR
jgi:hypothetical protein